MLRYVRARPRLFTAVVIAIIVYFAFPVARDISTRLLIAWNIGAGFFIVMAMILMLRANDVDMQRHAQQTDEGRFAVLLSATVAACVSLAAIVIELSRFKSSSGNDAVFYVVLSIVTIFVSWSFIQLIFTEHYAHEYYMKGNKGRRTSDMVGSGLDFPGEKHPDYIDFLYFTVTIGVANQTVDVSIHSREMRILVLIQSAIAYFFNATILALSINIVSSML